MATSRTKIIIGGGLATLAAEMIVDPSVYISYPLLAVGLFLLAWGVVPERIEQFVGRLPKGNRLNDLLGRFDIWLEGAANKERNPQIATDLKALYRRGCEIRDGRILSQPDLGRAEAWEADAMIYLRENVPAHAFMYETYGDTESGVVRVRAKLAKLRLIIGKYE